MLNKKVFSGFIFIILTTVFSPVSCVNYKGEINQIAKAQMSKYMVEGKLEIFDLSIKENKKAKEIAEIFPEFFVQATTEEIGRNATVAIIYPPDHPEVNLKDKTVATGLTDSTGKFTINPDINFTPIVNSIFILEASSRIGGAGNEAISLRTNIRWTGKKWESITKDNILINKKTTALSLISAFHPDEMLSPEETINKLVLVNDSYEIEIIEPHDENIKINHNYVVKAIEQILENNLDPVKSLKKNKTNLFGYADQSEANLKGNMQTFQIMLETYAVEWAGFYPENIEKLIEDAKINNYYHDMENLLDPYSANIKRPQIFLEFDEYQIIKDHIVKENLKGVILYEAIRDEYNYITLYRIYGFNEFGDFLLDVDKLFYLTNN